MSIICSCIVDYNYYNEKNHLFYYIGYNKKPTD